MSDLVSIIIPVYNVENAIIRCINSVQKQTYENLQIICVNDGSKDNSLGIIEKMAQNDKRIVVLNKKNGGASSARNYGIRYSNGKYIQFVDADDALEINATNCLLRTLKENDLDLVMCGYHSSDGLTEKKLPFQILALDKLTSDFALFYHTTYLNPPWNKMFIKSKIETFFPEDMSLGEDLVFNLHYIKQCARIGIIPNMEYIYTVGRLNSLTTKYDANGVECLEKKISEMIAFLPEFLQMRTIEQLQTEFWTDYKRCIEGIITCGSLDENQLIHTFIEIKKSEIWNLCFSGYKPDCRIESLFFDNQYRKYIRYVDRMHQKRIIKSKMKDIVKEIENNSKQFISKFLIFRLFKKVTEHIQ
nr:glycosyltransferase family 2 protein [uncultured Acetatifactor sp.]